MNVKHLELLNNVLQLIDHLVQLALFIIDRWPVIWQTWWPL